MPNWDDQFDFDDLDNDKGKAKPSAKAKDKKVTNQDDQFFDDVNSAPKKEVKSILPTINTRNSAKSNKPLVQTPKVNPFANKSFGSKEAVQDEFQEDFQQEIQESPKPKQQPAKTSSKDIKPTLSLPSNNQPKPKNQVKQEEYDDEFYEQQLEEPLQKSVQNKKNNNVSKNSEKHLPTQPSNTASKNQDSRQSLNLSKPAAKAIEKSEDADEYDDEFENDEYGEDDFEEEVKSPVKKIAAKVNQLVDSIQSKSNPKLNIKTQQTSKTIEPPQKQKYNSVKPSNNPPKGKQIQTRSQSVVPPKPPGNKTKQPTISSKNITKPQFQSLSKPLKRSASRQSIRSNGDNKSIKGSRISQRNESQFFPNKHLAMVDKSFPQDQDKLNVLSQLQINKINEKMRAMIRKFNQELNDLINKNMLLLKNKSLDKHLSLEERIRQLEIQKKSGETAIEVMEKDFDKLQGREGELREEEYQLILEKQIEERKAQIKETTKEITVLKRQVDNKGKKLSAKQAQQQNAQNIHHLKTNIIQARKQQEKGDERIQKLTSTFEQLQTKISDIDYKLQELISEAKEKGVTIQNTDNMNKKYDELKNKLQNIKNFNTKAESLNNTKLQILNHENDQVRISIRNVTSQISNLYGSIDHSQSQAIKLIQKAKEKVGINPLFAESLDKLLKQLEQSRSSNDHDYFDARSEIKSRRSESTKNKASKNEDIEKSMPLRVTQSQNRLLDTQDSAAKPKFLKKKPEQAKLDIENKSKVNERVWNNQAESSKPHVNDQNKHKAVSSAQQGKLLIEDKIQAAKQVIEEEKKDKSKPFMLKKNKPSEGKVDEVKDKPSFSIQEKVNIELSLPVDPLKNEEKQESVNINLAPRMMKFGRKKNTEDTTSQNNLSLNDNPSPKNDTSKPIQLSLEKKDNGAKLSLNLGGEKIQGLSLQIGEAPKKTEEEDKPIFVPKRFNLRGKVEKKEDEYVPAAVKKDNEYTSSVQANTKIEKPTFAQKQQKKEEYQPKLNFLNDEPVKNPFKKEPEPPVEQQPEIKPRFNLRLRDKANTNQDSYEPSRASGLQLNLNANIQQSNGTNQLNLQLESKLAQNDFIAPKQNIVKANDNEVPKSNPYNPYAPKVEPQVGIKLNVEPKKEEIFTSPPENLNANNPYAAKFQGSQQPNIPQAPKRQRGPLKKNKISSNMPKQSFNIYAQADDITNEVKEIGAKTANQNPYAPTNNAVSNNPQPVKQNEKFNINDMLGIKKETKKNDFDDLLGDVGVTNAKNKKKNNDFFNDLQF